MRRLPFHLLSLSIFVLSIAFAGGPATGDVWIPPRSPEPRPTASPFLLQETVVRTTISGPVAHVRVTQGWHNPNQGPVDGLYIFPLPENAAVTDMSLLIGKREIAGEMKRREEARALYEQARREGRIAGLLDQERPNLFAQRVANIMPGARISVVLEFDQEIRCEAGACEYFFPTVVGPRFIPAHQANPGAIDPPVVAPGDATGQRLSLQVDIDAAVSLHDLESPSHRVIIERDGETRARVTLGGPPVALDRDFRLRWTIGADAPEFGLLTWRQPLDSSDPGVFSLILQPPAADAAGFHEADAPGRELVFVLDCSGSMSGMPIDAAKRVVRQALGALRPQDTFQIIRFSERASGLGARPLRPTQANLTRALEHLESLRGSGGTMMIEGIRAALSTPVDPERLRIVAFLTDGYIGNEREILAEVRKLIGNARLFAFGIGSSVNRYLLEGLAEEGRGEAAFLGPREKPDEMVDRFVRRIATPVLTDIRITWEDVEVEDLEPAAIPDLFAGQPLLVHGRYRQPGTGVVVVEGWRGDIPVTMRHVVILPEAAADNQAIGRLWARARIHRLTREMHGGERADVVEIITALGLRHRLMTAWTSLVAVDSVVSNAGGSTTSINVPVELPEDVSYEGVFGKVAHKNLMRSLAVGAAGQQALLSGRLGGSYNVAISESDARKRPDTRPVADAPSSRDARRNFHLFEKLTLIEADDVRLVLEADGELWRLEGKSRRLVRTLTAADLDALRQALATARPSGWPGAESGPRLLLEAPGLRASISLNGSAATVQALAALLRTGSR